MTHANLRKNVLGLTLLLSVGPQAKALPIEILPVEGSLHGPQLEFSWSGTVDNVVFFSANALPITVAVGDHVQGSVGFDQLGYDHTTYIQGNTGGGYSYSYSQGLRQSFSIGGLSWVVDAGFVSLTDTYFNFTPDPFSWRSLGIDSWSQHGDAIEFPNLVGNYEAGIALQDDELPFDLYDTNILGNATFDLSAAKFGSGLVTAREWDQSGDIVRGYYISFTIDSVTSSVPIAGSAWLVGLGLSGLAVFRKRNLIC